MIINTLLALIVHSLSQAYTRPSYLPNTTIPYSFHLSFIPSLHDRIMAVIGGGALWLKEGWPHKKQDRAC